MKKWAFNVNFLFPAKYVQVIVKAAGTSQGDSPTRLRGLVHCLKVTPSEIRLFLENRRSF